MLINFESCLKHIISLVHEVINILVADVQLTPLIKRGTNITHELTKYKRTTKNISLTCSVLTLK